MNRTFNKAVATLLALLAPALLVLFRWAYGTRIPDPLPTHWSGSTVDGTTDAGTFFGVLLVIALVLAVAVAAVLWLGRADPAGRFTVCALIFGSWLLTAMYVGIVLAAADVAVATDVRLPWYDAVGTVGIALVAAGFAWLLLPARPSAPQAGSGPTPVPLGPTERVVWIGRAASAPVLWVGAVGVLIAGVLALFSVLVAAIVFVVSMVLVGISQLGVRIDAGGLHTIWGPFGWPRSTVPLAQITAVRADVIRPMEWGGWGLRFSPKGKAAIVRAGEAIIVDRAERSRYLVTVDGAREGADVLAALVERAGHSR